MFRLIGHCLSTLEAAELSRFRFRTWCDIVLKVIDMNLDFLIAGNE